MCQINRQIPKEIWPPPREQAPWDAWPENPALLTPYHKAIMEAQKQYKDNIPDPSEWSQDYPWYESSASKMPKEDNDHMETEDGEDSTSTDSAQLPFSNRDYMDKKMPRATNRDQKKTGSPKALSQGTKDYERTRPNDYRRLEQKPKIL
ncbi:hypothetical protein V6N11_043405 [Hibiscus sabdariffa]|uniref:Uncharacterized protein n=1 Tax=Hibiscus sabdariffa TaxID=183260 RepID=A0ABR2RCK4_9ROSI